MKKPWLFMLVAALVGTSTAWAINRYQYGSRSVFGPFGTASDVTPDNVMAYIDSLVVKGGRPIAEVVGGETTYDFGMMAPGSEGEHVFVITNSGDVDLDLKVGMSTCKCTFGNLDQNVLKPGQETEVTLSWGVKTGELNFAQSAEILTNDPGRAAIKFSITGKVIQELDVVPEAWTFGEVATGEPIEVSGVIYNFMDYDIDPRDVRFGNETLADAAEITVDEFKPTEEEDGMRSVARQAFRVNVRFDGGLRQGSVSQQLMFGFVKLDSKGKPLPSDEDPRLPAAYVSYVPINGHVVGPLSLIVTSDIDVSSSGAFTYKFGKVGPDDSLKRRIFVVLKGNERDNTTLSIGETSPEGVVKATLGNKVSRGLTTLYPLTIELVPQSETIERMARDPQDIGSIRIESDNPKVSYLVLGVTFSLEAR